MSQQEVDFNKLKEKIDQANLPENVMMITDHLMTSARRRTPLWEHWRIAAEIERIIRTYEKESAE